MSAYTLKMTAAGLAELATADAQGLEIKLTHIALGTTDYTPTGAETSLRKEAQREPIIDYQKSASPDQVTLWIAARFAGELDYPIRELGIFTDAGTLFAIASMPGRYIGYKASGDVHVEQVGITISALPSQNLSISVTDSAFSLLSVTQMIEVANALTLTHLTQIRHHDRIKKLEKAA